jgi:hypothetical protein
MSRLADWRNVAAAEETIFTTMLDLQEVVLQMNDVLARKSANIAVREKNLLLCAWLQRNRETPFSLEMTVGELADRQEAVHVMVRDARSALVALQDSDSD